jgi:hypothetical protein
VIKSNLSSCFRQYYACFDPDMTGAITTSQQLCHWENTCDT